MQKTGKQEIIVEFDGERKISKDDVIKNLDEYNCPIKCIVNNKGCRSAYNGTNLSYSDSVISFANTKNIDGQISEVCLICNNIAR